MPRYARKEAPGALHHVISRIINREFRITSDRERNEYLRRVTRLIASVELNITLFAYCLMSNHTHWAMVIERFTSARFIHPLHTGYAAWLNREQGRLGPVFAERHTSLEFKGESAARLIAYDHNNPVRAGVVSDPADSNWTSHRAYIGDVAAPPWLQVERGLAASGFSSSPSGRLAFHDFVRSVSGQARDPMMSGGDPVAVRVAARAQAGGPVEIAAPVETADGLAHELRALQDATLHPAWSGSPATVTEIVAHAAGVTADELRSRDRSRHLADARRLLLLVWTEFLGRRQQEMSAHLGISTSGGSHLLHRDRALTAALLGEAQILAQLCWEGRAKSPMIWSKK